jgi:hypothetical protein
MIIVAVGLLAYYHTGSIDGTSTAFASIAETAKRVPWMHIEVKGMSDKLDAWVCYHEGIIAIKRDNKEVMFIDTAKRASWQYDPNSKIITKRTAKENDSAENDLGAFGNSPINFCDQIISLIKDAGGEVQEKKAVLDEKSIVIYRMRGLVQDHNMSVELVIDAERKLPLSVRQTVEEGKTIIEANGRFDYPDQGPQSIYELGVPKDAKLNEITSPAIMQGESIARKAYRDEGERVAKTNYVMVAARAGLGRIDQIDLVYNKGKQRRIEHSLIGSPTSDIGSTAESMLAWAKAYKVTHVAIYVYDGKYGCFTQKNEGSSWKGIKKQRWTHTYGPDIDLAALGWPAFNATNMNEIEDEYASGHGYICFESINKAQVRDGKLIFPAERTLYYIDPNHDYMRVCEEMYWNNSYREHEPKIETLNFDPNVIPEKSSTIRAVTEFGQMADGKWYPKRIESRMPKWDSSGKEIETSPYESTDIYLETEPNYPNDIFDCDKLPK